VFDGRLRATGRFEVTVPDAADSDAQVRWTIVVLGGLALFACLPAMLGALGEVLIRVLWANDVKWPAETALGRAVVISWGWSLKLAMMSPPATVVGALIGAWAIKRAGWRTALGKAVAIVLALAFVSTGVHYINMRQAVQDVEEPSGWRPPSPK
jgi:hypothetical protein